MLCKRHGLALTMLVDPQKKNDRYCERFDHPRHIHYVDEKFYN